MLRDQSPLTRIEVARRTGLSPTTITRVVAELVEDGSVLEGATVSRTKTGRPGTEISIEPRSYFVVGVQVGVGFARLAAADLLGQPIESAGFEFDPALEPSLVLDEVAAAVLAVVAEAGLDRSLMLGVGVAVPGPVDDDHRRLLMPINLPWRDVPVADHLERAIGARVVVEHNVRSMALAEARFGAGRSLRSVAFVYLRTGIGAGLVVEGQAFQAGVHGAIEIGHLRIVDGGEKCVCGGVGCLETVLSEAALREVVDGLGLPTTSTPPLLALLAAADEDPAAAAAVESLVGHFATALSALVDLLNPEVILLGGYLSEVPEQFVTALTEATRDAVFPFIRPSVRLERSTLGIDAGVNGAATVALDHFFYA